MPDSSPRCFRLVPHGGREPAGVRLRLLRPGRSLWLSYLGAGHGHVGADVTWKLRIVEDGGDGGVDEVVAVYVKARPVDYGAVVEVLDDVVPDLSRASELYTDGAATVRARDR